MLNIQNIGIEPMFLYTNIYYTYEYKLDINSLNLSRIIRIQIINFIWDILSPIKFLYNYCLVAKCWRGG